MVATFRRIVSHIPMMQTSTYIKHRSSCWKIYSSCESKTLLLNAYIKKYVRSYVSLKFWWFFFCKYLNFCQRNTIDKDEKIHFFFKLKRQFFLSWELHRSKNRCRSKIYNGKFSHLSFFSFGSYSEFLRNILIHIDCSLSIQRSFWNFSLITCMFILFLIVFSCIIIPIERKKIRRNYSLTCTVLPTR